MPFLCDATAYVPLDPPGRLGDLSICLMDSIEELEDGLRAVVSGEVNGAPVQVSFLFVPWAYCVSNESHRIATAPKIAASKDNGAALYLVQGSEWLERFLQEYGYGEDLQHYLIVTGGDWLDVIADRPPKIEWL